VAQESHAPAAKTTRVRPSRPAVAAKEHVSAFPPPDTVGVGVGAPAAVPEPPPSAPAPVESTLAKAPAPVPIPPSVPATPAERPVDLQRELQDVVHRYAAAIEARNLPALQRVYPGMTQPQQRGWEQFFQLVKDVRADLDITGLDQRSGSPEAQVTGTYSYLNTSTGKAERQPVSFHAVFHQDGGQWQIGQVR
jgi:hypothetical protein